MTQLPRQPWMSSPVIAALGEARFIGGCVRDTVLGLPVSDIDIATPLEPAEVMKRLEAAGIRAIPTGIAHGTVTALAGVARFEITTLRRDVACFGRHAEVAFTDDWQADAARRDFTINALSCTPDGVVYDPFGGLEDLAAGHIRFIGSAEQRIREDVLRLLRFFRFYGRYGKAPPDREALAACRALAPLLPGLSGERVRAELFRLLTGPRPDGMVRLMADTGVLPVLLPEATRLDRLKAVVGMEARFGLAGEDRAVPRLAALLDTDINGALCVAGNLRLSRAERDRLAFITDIRIEPDCGLAELCRFVVGLEDDQLFLDCVLLACGSDWWVAQAQALAARRAAAPFPLSGGDFVALGVPPGPRVGWWLGQLKEWWAGANLLPDRAACLAEAVRRLSGSR